MDAKQPLQRLGGRIGDAPLWVDAGLAMIALRSCRGREASTGRHRVSQLARAGSG
jgi:hypothetical protein